MTLAHQIRTEREALIDLLLTLDDEQWETASLCEGWKVIDVAAHLAWAPVLDPVDMAASFVRARGLDQRLHRPDRPPLVRRGAGVDHRPAAGQCTARRKAHRRPSRRRTL